MTNAGRTRTRGSTVLSVGAGVATLALVTSCGAGIGAGRPADRSPAAAGPQKATGPVGLRTTTTFQDLKGRWYAVSAAGIGSPNPHLRVRPYLEFKPDRTWAGSDGCSGLQGSFRLPDRAMSMVLDPTRGTACNNFVPDFAAVTSATLDSDRHELRLFGKHGQEIAKYARRLGSP